MRSGSPDELPDYQPPPYEPAPSLFERARSLAREATSTPRRASIATLCGVAAIALVLAAWPVQVEATDQRGPLTAECGLDVVVFGHPDTTAERACRDAVAGRAAVAAVALAALAVGFVGLVQLLLARSGRLAQLWSAVWARPHRAALAGATVLAAVAVAVTSRSVPTEVAADGGALSVRCGVDTVLLGHAMEPVERACRDTLTTEAAVFVPAVLVLVVGLVGLLRLLAGVARQPLGVALVVACGLAVLSGLVALRPVTVEVDVAQGDSMLVSCGIDAAVSGHAIERVEDACRDEVGSNAAGFAGAVLVLAVAAGGLWRISRAPLARPVPGWR